MAFTANGRAELPTSWQILNIPCQFAPPGCRIPLEGAISQYRHPNLCFPSRTARPPHSRGPPSGSQGVQGVNAFDVFLQPALRCPNAMNDGLDCICLVSYWLHPSNTCSAAACESGKRAPLAETWGQKDVWESFFCHHLSAKGRVLAVVARRGMNTTMGVPKLEP